MVLTMRFAPSLFILLSTLLGFPEQRPTQRPAVASAHLEGRVTLSTGAPARGATVTVHCIGCLGRMRIDSTGRYSVDVPAGRLSLELRCFTATTLGHVVESPTLVLKAGERRVHNFVFQPNACREPPFSTLWGSFRGIYVHHWEGSTFSFCDEVPLPVREVLARSFVPGAVAVSASIANVTNLLDHVGVMPNSQGETPLYVEWRGMLAGPGQYGTWGLASYGFTVDSVRVVRAMQLTDCPRINPLAARTPARFDTAAVVLAAWRTVMTQPAAPGRPAVLSVTSRLDRHTMPLSPLVTRQLRERGVPIVRPVDLYGSTVRDTYHIADLEMLRDSSVSVVMGASYFLPSRNGFEVFKARGDSVRVRCEARVCTARLVRSWLGRQ
ncbi:MAG: carboxypeptidase-like regulatory domain-containing protein [Gemmatimonas sp.]